MIIGGMGGETYADRGFFLTPPTSEIIDRIFDAKAVVLVTTDD